VHADLVQLVRETAPRLRSQPPESNEASPPEREELLASVTRARAEDRLEDALEGCRRLLNRDSEDEAARRAMAEIESVLLEREIEALVGMALAYAADGQLELATGIAEKVERLAPWSARYLQLQVYLDEEGARHQANALVAGAREHLEAGRVDEARAKALEATLVMPGHSQAPGSPGARRRRLRPPWRPAPSLRGPASAPGRPGHPRPRHDVHSAGPPPAAAAAVGRLALQHPRAEAVALRPPRSALPEGRPRPGAGGRRAGAGTRPRQPARAGAAEDPARARLNFAL
jgi:tetratricopeptide (TPR) repeat protein